MDLIIPTEKFDLIKSDLAEFMPVLDIEVVDDATEAEASTYYAAGKNRLKQMEDLRTNLVKPVNDHVKKINNMFKMMSEPLEGKMYIINNKITNFKREKMRQAEEAARKLREEAEAKRRAEEAELRRIEAEKKRIEDERIAQEKALAEAKAAADMSLTPESFKEVEQLEASMEALNKQEAVLEKEEEKIEEQINNDVPMVVAEPEQKVRTEAGLVSSRKVKKFEVVDQQMLPEHLKIPNEAAIRKLVTEGIQEIPGVRIYEDIVLTHRS